MNNICGNQAHQPNRAEAKTHPLRLAIADVLFISHRYANDIHVTPVEKPQNPGNVFRKFTYENETLHIYLKNVGKGKRKECIFYIANEEGYFYVLNFLLNETDAREIMRGEMDALGVSNEHPIDWERAQFTKRAPLKKGIIVAFGKTEQNHWLYLLTKDAESQTYWLHIGIRNQVYRTMPCYEITNPPGFAIAE